MRHVRHRARWYAGYGLVLAGMGAFFGACSTSSGPDAEPLIGDWEWVRSTGGIAGLTLTPASEGYTVVLRFASDGRAEWWRDGVLTQSTTYQIVRDTTGGNEAWTVTYAAPLSGFAEQRATFPSANTLVLTDPCCDGFEFEFQRSAGP